MRETRPARGAGPVTGKVTRRPPPAIAGEVLVARRQPRNPEGWLLLGGAVAVIALVDSGLYAVLDYRVHDGPAAAGRGRRVLQGHRSRNP